MKTLSEEPKAVLPWASLVDMLFILLIQAVPGDSFVVPALLYELVTLPGAGGVVV